MCGAGCRQKCPWYISNFHNGLGLQGKQDSPSEGGNAHIYKHTPIYKYILEIDIYKGQFFATRPFHAGWRVSELVASRLNLGTPQKTMIFPRKNLSRGDFSPFKRTAHAVEGQWQTIGGTMPRL